MLILLIISGYFLMGVIGLVITYNRPTSLFYGNLDIETICIGLLAAPGCFTLEIIAIFDESLNLRKVVFKRKLK